MPPRRPPNGVPSSSRLQRALGNACTLVGLATFVAQEVDRFLNGTSSDQWLTFGALGFALAGQSPRVADALATWMSKRMGR